MNYCFDYDEFYGDKFSVSYFRWLYNRYGINEVIKIFNLSKETAISILNSQLPGKIKVSEINTIDKLNKLKIERNNSIEKRNKVIFENNKNVLEFRKINSRRIKLRLNKLVEFPIISVLKYLIIAEESNITAKNAYGRYIDLNYFKKSEYLKKAITELKNTNLKYVWQSYNEQNANYVFYVILPTGQQVSWHGINVEDMKDVTQDESFCWDNQLATTLPKLINCLISIVPSIMEEKFNKPQCILEIKNFLNDKK